MDIQGRPVHLSDTLVSPKLAVSLLSVPALVDKNIGVIFLPGQGLLVDLENDFKILGFAHLKTDGLSYIEVYHDERSTNPKISD